FVSPLTTLVQAEIEAGSSVEQAIGDIQALLDTDADLLADYVAKEESGDADAYQRLHEIAQVATQIIANNAEDVAEAAADQSAESTAGELFELVIAAVVEDIDLIADAVDEDDSEEFDPTTVFAVVEDEVEIDTTDIDDQVEEQQLEQDTDVADLGMLITSGGGLNWFEVNVDHGAFVGAWIGTLTYDADTEETTEFELEWVDGEWVTEEGDGAHLILTTNGWLTDNEVISVESINDDGSINVTFATSATVDGVTYNGEHISGREVNVSGLEIALFVGVDDEEVDSSLYFGDAVFGDGAMAYQVTFTGTTDTYRIWDWGCEEPLGGVCNSVWHRNGDGDYSSDNHATSMSTVIVSEAVSTETVAENASLLNAISAGRDISVELVEGGAVNFYSMDWSDGGSASKIGTGTWGLHTVGEEEAYVVSPEASVRASLDLDAGEELMYAAYNGYVRKGFYRPAGASEAKDDEWSFNGIGWQNIQDNFSESEPVEPLGCNYVSGWDEALEEPAIFNSYTEFLAAVEDCGGVLPTTDADVIGTWIETLSPTEQEQLVFNSDFTVTLTDLLNGVPVSGTTVTGTWSITNNLMTVELGGSDLATGIFAFTSQGVRIYTEETSWGSDLVPDSAADGEIWIGSYVKQTSSSNPTEF
ncbi:MAG: hypothetical protein KUG67_01020, partial [Proteobacteria bacterium]|nr:hypothetical protein [Pseudomonadota bacterium]